MKQAIFLGDLYPPNVQQKCPKGVREKMNERHTAEKLGNEDLNSSTDI
jgi:hypothetical protein